MIDITYKGNNFHLTYTLNSSGNCGITSVYGVNFMQMGKKTDKVAPAKYDPFNPNVIGSRAIYEPLDEKDKLSPKAIYEALCANIETLAGHFQSSIIYMSDRMANVDGSLVKVEDKQKVGLYFYGLDTAYFMRAIRETRCGLLILSQVVENKVHVGSSIIQGAFWTPPQFLKHVVYSRPRWSKGAKKVKCGVAERLVKGAKAFLKDMYDEPQDSKRAA